MRTTKGLNDATAAPRAPASQRATAAPQATAARQATAGREAAAAEASCSRSSAPISPWSPFPALLRITDRRRRLADPAQETEQQHWIAHDFILHFGGRDGLGFACELEAWLMPEADYYRTTPETPETPEELARFGVGPPDLHIVTQAVFTRGTMNIPRSDDPLALARRYLREEAGCEDFHQPEVKWALRRNLDNTNYDRLPGWTSTVTFRTRPAE